MMRVLKKWVSVSFIFLLCWHSLTGSAVKAQPAISWQLQKDKDQIRVYSRHREGSRLTELKVECILPGTLSQLVALLSDIPNYEKVIYRTKSAYVLQRPTEDQLLYHIVNDFPWPVNDRDMTVQLNFAQDPASKLLTIRATGVPDVVPVQPGIVRIADWGAVWQVRPVANRSMQVIYTCRMDPGGSIPVWLDNVAAATGAYSSFALIRDSLPRYQGKTVRFLRD